LQAVQVGLCLADWVGDHWMLIIVALSIIKTIHGYPTGGGIIQLSRAQIWHASCLSPLPALLVDYILNAAVSLTAGVAAGRICVSWTWPYRVALS